MLYPAPRYLDAGEAALSVEFGDSVDPEINARVLALDEALRESGARGVEECAPTYRSLMVHYDPLVLPRDELVALLEKSDDCPCSRLRFKDALDHTLLL